jgi:hypothetical protein
LRLLKKLLAAPLVLAAAVIILVEDWLWDDLARLAAAIGRLPVFSAIEGIIARLPPYGALACFGVPTLLFDGSQRPRDHRRKNVRAEAQRELSREVYQNDRSIRCRKPAAIYSETPISRPGSGGGSGVE